MRSLLLLVGCLFICAVCVSTIYAEATISHVIRSKRSSSTPSSEQNYMLMVREQGSRFNEKVRFDMNKKTAVFEVPAHRDFDHAVVMIDFNSNLTATRLPGKNECHVRARSPEEPSMDLLKSSMDKVASGRSSVQSGSRLFSSTWGIKGPADLSKLSSKVIGFCRGSPILELTKFETDGVSVINGNGRSRRSSTLPFPLCTRGVAAWVKLIGCSEDQYVTKCQFPSRSCVYWVTCPNGLTGLRDPNDPCNSAHQRVRIICCDLSCP